LFHWIHYIFISIWKLWMCFVCRYRCEKNFNWRKSFRSRR